MYSFNDPYFQQQQKQYSSRHHPYQYQQQRPPQYYKYDNAYSAQNRNHFATMLWDQTKQLPKEAFKMVEEAYEASGFYLQVRLHLASFVEAKFMPNIDVDDNTASNLASQLLSQFDAKISAIPNDPDKFMEKSKLQDMSISLKQAYSSNLAQLFLAVRSCLDQERNIVAQYSTSLTPSTSDGGFASGECELSTQIRQQIEILKGKVSEAAGKLDRCRQEQEAFSMEFYNCKEQNSHYETKLQQLGEQHPDTQKLKKNQEAMNKSIRTKYMNLTGHRAELTHIFKQIYEMCKEVQSIVLEKELVKWKREQQLSGNGFSMTAGRLEVIQEWCEALADITWTTRQQVKQLQGLREIISDPQGSNTEQDLLANITSLLTNLITGTFIIEKQPPQVMKTNTRFTATVRLLVGGILNVHMAAPSVAVSIVSESQANQLLVSNSNTTKRKEDYNSGDILNGTGTMEYQNATKQVSVTFRNLQLKKIKRTEKKGTESVMDEKFSVIFWTEFTVGDLRFNVWSMSLPVVVIVHGNQEPQALATVTWDNAFGEWGRRPFHVPDKVTWGQIGSALNMKWTHACGSPLTTENLYYLACKAFRNNNLPMNDMDEINNLVLSWQLFCKENLPERNFTFWEWFYRILILTQSHMQKLWMEGFVMGFVTKQAAENLLLGKPNGTFLLRFSDSELGGVTIAYVRQHDPYEKPSVFMLAPFTTRNLSQRCMADVIFDLADLSVLYPETPKEKFRKFSSKSSEQGPKTTNGYGYVQHTLVTQVEGQSASSNMGVYSGTYSPAPVATPGAHGSHYDDQNSMPYGGEEMDFNDQNIDLMAGIDVTQILGITDDFMNPAATQPPNAPANF